LILSNHNMRTKLFTPALVDELSFEQMEKIYKERMTDAGDFTFFIVGNIEEEKVKPLVEKYIGSITDLSRTETWKDNNITGPKGKTVREIQIPMEDNKATVVVNFKKADPFNPKTNLMMDILSGILRLRYTDEIREKEGGSYAVGVSASKVHYPKQEKVLQLSFDAEPQRAEQLKSILYREIDKLVDKGPTADDLDKVVKNLLKDREQSKLHNAYWLNAIYGYYQDKINPDAPENFEKILGSLTGEDVKSFAAGFFKTADVVDIVFVPAKK